MKTVIDIVLLIIIVVCTWNGYKRGLIGGLAGILAIVVALLGGSLLSSAFSHEVIPALEPFVGGYVDSQENRVDIMEKIGVGGTVYSLEDTLRKNPELCYDYARENFIKAGISEKRAEELAVRAVNVAEKDGVSMPKAVTAVLCETITGVGALVIGFLLILILLVAMANVVNLSFRLPNMESVDEVGGAVLGFGKGFLYCVLVSWLLSFLGLLIGGDTMNSTTLGRFFLLFDFITGSLL